MQKPDCFTLLDSYMIVNYMGRKNGQNSKIQDVIQ